MFFMGRGSGTDACPAGMTCPPHEAPEHAATVSPFVLDAFEVTVGRFRSFFDAYESWMPEVGAGAHPSLAGSGYLEEFSAALPVSREELGESLACDTEATWTPVALANEALPINCVNWAVALSFCIWDGGRLPTEAEWEFAAAGGDENRLYPWGASAPDDEVASFFPGAITRAGVFPAGRGRYESSDLAGNVWEWTLDWLDTGWYAGGGATCVDCARVSSGTHRTLRGGAYSYEAVTLRAATRSGEVPTSSSDAIGFRCAYDEK
jgi:formylglycine-generating enzyme required for sulfatase activity